MNETFNLEAEQVLLFQVHRLCFRPMKAALSRISCVIMTHWRLFFTSKWFTEKIKKVLELINLSYRLIPRKETWNRNTSANSSYETLQLMTFWEGSNSYFSPLSDNLIFRNMLEVLIVSCLFIFCTTLFVLSISSYPSIYERTFIHVDCEKC